jgi:hypothetical protein
MARVELHVVDRATPSRPAEKIRWSVVDADGAKDRAELLANSGRYDEVKLVGAVEFEWRRS